MINITIKNTQSHQNVLTFPHDNGFSLMEILRASGLPIAATCGGMALCATCLVTISGTTASLPKPDGAEADMLDTLPDITEDSRLSCQIRADDSLDGCTVQLAFQA